MLMQQNPVIRLLKSNPYQNLHEFFEQNGVRPQIFNLDAHKEQSIHGRLGTRFHIPAFAFKNEKGQTVKGKVQLFIKEVFTKSEMVLANKFSTTEDRLMNSNGQIFISTKLDDQELILDRAIQIELPVQRKLNNTTAIKLFSESEATARSVNLEHAFDWKAQTKKSLNIIKDVAEKFFSFSIDHLGWYSCNNMLEKKGRSMFSIKYTSTYGALDQKVAFLVLKDWNTVVRMYPKGQGFTSFNIPKNISAEIIILGIKQEQLFMGNLTIPNISNSIYLVQIEPVNEEKVMNTLL